MSTVEIVDASLVRLGARSYRMFTLDKALDDGTLLSVETYGRPQTISHGLQNKFSLDDLAGVLSSDLPDKFSFMAYEPALDTPGLDNIYFKSRGGKQYFVGAIFQGYQEWSGAENLADYGARLATQLRAALPRCISSKPQRDEYGVTLWFTAEIPTDTDLAEYVRSIDSQAYRSVIEVRSNVKPSTATPPALKPDERGPKWWIRYVAVPLLGSATVLALIAMLTKLLS
ncbi:hypothetical protein J2X02_003466 [Pseudoxanthomonas japonensis]|uniref:hypothetical protein n=1 Tax=Pseudoxanthomonas japonensis TaxID=69284 RepID=UPI00285986EB|nr:hypothetical protein [Pseudoxanthomonas japonensis]MDR7070601.1 hypothetical protein [Pseudoxanthomonas japonensis]